MLYISALQKNNTIRSSKNQKECRTDYPFCPLRAPLCRVNNGHNNGEGDERQNDMLYLPWAHPTAGALVLWKNVDPIP